MIETPEYVAALSPEKRALLELLLKRKGNVFNTFPLSFAQQRLWFLDQLEPGSPLYNISLAVRLTGTLDRDALARAISEVVRRHEVLRTTFPLAEGRPVQVVNDAAPVPLALTDLRTLDPGAAESEARRILGAESRGTFDLSTGPLLRTRLVRLGEQEHVLVLVMHHIVSDGWSTGVLVREVTALYAAYSAGHESPLAELPIQYADFAVWQRKRLTGELLDEQLSYWRGQLTGAPPVLELPTDRPRPPVQSFRGASEALTLDIELTESLKALSRSEGVTLFMTLLAAFQVLLSRYSGQTDVVVGTDSANRQQGQTESLVGFFINQLALRGDLSGDPTFRGLLARAREATLGAYAHQEVPFEKVVEELRPERSLSHTPLFQVKLVFQNVPAQTLSLPGLKVGSINSDSRTAKFDLTLFLAEEAGRIVGVFEYNTDLFDATTIRRFISHFKTLLAGAAAAPDQRISTLPLLTERERRQLVCDWNDTARVYPHTHVLHRLIEEQTERTPEAVALAYEGEQLSYAELDRRASRLARLLSMKGVGPDVVVGLMMERSVEMVVSLLAILKAGGAYLPLDPEYPADRLSFMLEDSAVSLLLTQQRLAASVPELFAGDGVEVICVDSEVVADEPGDDCGFNINVTPDNVAYVIYTSGSTGRPKGVMVSHRAIANRLLWMQEQYGLTADDNVLQKTPYTFDVSVWEFFWPLLAGARLVVAQPGLHRDAAGLAQLMSAQAVTVLHFVPSMLQAFLADPSAASGLASARLVVCSGEALGRELSGKFYAACDGAELHNLYGPTEAAVDVSWWECEREGAEMRPVPIGRPISNVRLYVLDAALSPVPIGVAGELYIGGVCLARGYARRAGLTAERFVPDPFAAEPGARLYRTGDVARRLAGGEIEYLGRADHQVKVRGFRIELGEIEAALEQHARVREAVVTVQEVGGGDKRLVAYFVTDEGAGELKVAELRAHLRERLPEYMVPSLFVTLERMPVTSNGKVDRKALPAPDGARPELEEEYVAPSTPVEEVLCGIWSEVLGTERVGTADNFFNLGGDSILSIQVRARAQRAGLDFTLQQLFQHQTVRELARAIDGAESDAADVPETSPFSLVNEEDRSRLPEGLEDAYPLTALQAGMLYHMELMTDDPVYHNVNSYHLRARLDVAAFQEAVWRTVARHPVLRTSFDLSGYGEPLQLVHETAKPSVGVTDLRGLSFDEQERVLDEFVESEKNLRFDLTRPVQLRFHIHRRDAETFQFTFTENHAIIDGWSLHATLAEIFQHYFALLNGEAPPVEPPPSATFRDFVLLERMTVESDEGRRYWNEKLCDCTVTELPRWPDSYLDRAAPRMRIRQVAITDELSDGLKRLARAAGVPVKSVLLAAHLKAVSLLNGQADVLTGLVMNGRPEVADGEHVRGLFLNTVPLRARLEAGTWLELVRAAFDAERELLPFRRYPLALLQQQSGGRPLFDTVFNFVHFHNISAVGNSGAVELLGGKKYEATNLKLTAAFFKNPVTSKITFNLSYDSGMLPDEQIDAFASYYTQVLTAMTVEPSARHHVRCLLPASEMRRTLSSWNETRSPFREDVCIHQLLEQRAASAPEATALIFEDERLSYRELNERANRAARYLRQQGVGPEVRVGVMLERGVEMLVSVLAVLKAGGAYVPMDAQYPRERLEYMLEDSAVPLLLTQRSLADNLGGFGGVRVVCVEEERAAIDAEREENFDGGATAQSLAYVIYTSGSTGRPKGVMVEHRGLCNLAASHERIFGLGPESRVLQFASLSFDASIFEIVTAIAAGGALCLGRPDSLLPGPAFVELLEEHAVSFALLPPSVLAHMPDVELPSLKTLATGGEACSAESAARWAAGRRFFNLYGPTEATVYSTASECDAEGQRPLLGRPIINTQVYLLDADMQPVPVGVAGELYIGGAGIARGYLNRPALTAERFVPDAFGIEPGARLYRTGDLARHLPDGRIEYLGRIDHQVKVRGFRIELGEIEAALCAHESVRECVVAAQDSPSGDKRLVAYVVAEGGELKVSELRAHLQGRLPEYMVPASFVLLDEMPALPNGKIDRRALSQLYAADANDAAEYVAPRTPVEELLCAIWAEVLGVERVGADDNFFIRGGHSLLATKVISRVRQGFGVEVPLRALFEQPTVAGLATEVEAALAGGSAAGQSRAGSIPVAERDGEGLALSFAQQRLWFLDQFEPGNSAYNIPAAVRLKGRLDASALGRALSEVVRRHEVLRTTFALADGSPVQVITDARPELLTVDLQGLPESEREEKAKQLATEEASYPFDLSQAPLLRALLLQLDEEDHVLILTTHHIASDGWSTNVLLREMATLYVAYSAGHASPLAELPIQYADFAAWQRNRLTGELLDTQLSYWREQLSGVPPVLELPTDRPRPAAQSFRGANESFTLDEELSEALKALSRSEGVTLFMTLLAGFNVLLSRYSGQRDVVVGTPIAGRNQIETEALVGFFVNQLALRVTSEGDPSFQGLLGRVKEVTLGAYAHQDVPFEKVVEELQPERNQSYSPVFQVVFTLQNIGREVVEVPGLEMSSLAGDNTTAKFDLTLGLAEESGRLVGALEYNTDLFDATTARRLVRHYQTLLSAAVADPSRRVSELPLLTEDERHTSLVVWNRTQVDFGTFAPAQRLFERQAEETPEAIALVHEDERLTYAELDNRANQLARLLSMKGVGPDVLVGLLMERSVEMVVSLLAVMKAGGAYLPLDPQYPAERLRFMVEDASVSLLLTQERLRDALQGHGAEVVCVDSINVSEGIDADGIDTNVTPDNLAYVIYTSGSTGRPKGVMVTHGGLRNYLAWSVEAYEMTEGQGSPVHSPLGFDLTVTSLFTPLLAGKAVTLLREEAGVEGLVNALRSGERFGLVKITPSHLELLNQLLSAEEAAGATRRFVIGGEALRGESLAFWRDNAPDTLIVNEYGPTETVVGCCVYTTAAGEVGAGNVSVGRPIANTRLYLLDEQLNPVPVGVAGELYIGGAGIARGYLNRPALTAEKFIPDSFCGETGSRLYKTGDLARHLPDGRIEYLGRMDQQVKVRGFRIELGEIEAALCAHDAVRECVVEARDGGDGKRLVAYFVPEGDRAASAELREYLSERLPAYMVPTAFVMLDAMPLTANGKVDRRALPEPGSAMHELAHAYVAPRTPVEEMLCGIWAEVLGTERVGINDNFFVLGGHSLLATKVVSRVRQGFGVEVALRTLFERPTVAGWALSVEAACEAAEGLTVPPIVPVAREEFMPVAYRQRSMWFYHQLQPESTLNNQAIGIRVRGPVDVVALESSLNEIVRRHEILRTGFVSREGEPALVVNSSATLELVRVDVSVTGDVERELEQLAAEEVNRLFDLASPPLMRAKLVRLGEEDHALLITIHHIVSDGWSLEILQRELSVLYRAFAVGEPSPLRELPVQYADFAAWQRRWLAGAVLDEQLAYWKRQLGEEPDVLELPTDRPRPSDAGYGRDYEADVVSFALDPELSERVRALSRRENASLFMTLLAAYQALLAHEAGRDEIAVGTPVAGRNRGETEGVIGLFVNQLALKTRLAGDPTFGELLGRVRDVTLGAYAHQDLPFNMIVSALHPEGGDSYMLPFQVKFRYENDPAEALEGAFELPGLDLSYVSLGQEELTTKLDMTLTMSEGPDGLTGKWTYNAELFDRYTIRRFVERYEELLAGAVNDPGRRLSDLLQGEALDAREVYGD
ncbi:MAG TPA: amino acid adenylation domain-containing protein [Pyrinomonadaceae bacterium]